ncbi:MAG: YgiQ family radical SAM protein [Candidatus Omnitrophota bacterium]|nr:YgiQ family radical SAM protein [Candidatus Omnitrophota bacterium]
MSIDFFPICRDDLIKRGWRELDIVLITGDAYVDHSSYGVAVIGRVLENAGFRIGIIAQPNWRNTKDFTQLGKPKLFFGITAGNVDSLVANYTANKKPRKVDDYSPLGKTGMRPDRATIVYANKVREAFPDTPIVLGGIEASLRRLAHYDYWDNCVRRSILVDAKANILVYGMGEAQILEIARRLESGEKIQALNNTRGAVVIRKEVSWLKNCLIIPSFEEVSADKNKFNEAFRIIYSQTNPLKAKPIAQKHGDRFVVQFAPALPLATEELDRIYELPYMRNYHPSYNRLGPVKSFETVKFSLISHRGCCGDCSFCSLSLHQGRIIQSRSTESIVGEAKLISELKGFRGTITDIGGPTANLYKTNCFLWRQQGFCADKNCLTPSKCKNLKLGYEETIALYRKIRQLPKVKHVFIGSGFRYDLLTEDFAREYLYELCKFHISGQMKVAPEHMTDNVLKLMNKPLFSYYEKFVRKFNQVNEQLKKKQYLVNYFISAHPGSTLQDALELALYMVKKHKHPEQVQDFIPLPMTLAGCIYYTETNPFTGDKVYVPKTFRERKMQRALIQYKNPKNRQLVREVLRILKAEHLSKVFIK